MDSDQRASDVPPGLVGDPDELLRVLQEAQLLLLKYPVTAQAGFRALVAEGRAFAMTPVGRRWQSRLARSELVRRGRILWEGSLLNMLEETSDSLIPSALLEAIIVATASGELSALLTRLLQTGNDNADADHP
jgi:hypothetical protein